MPRKSSPPEILDLKQAAALIHVSRRALSDHALSGEVCGAFRPWPGGPWRFRRAELLGEAPKPDGDARDGAPDVAPKGGPRPAKSAGADKSRSVSLVQ
ncbi:MAG: helix-turn-helix domain-containing protein [Deltaproteobacteria bacterium]|nr:helix-turn-helix domain-containing protein [Deltaproteobacteria bacterium]